MDLRPSHSPIPPGATDLAALLESLRAAELGGAGSGKSRVTTVPTRWASLDARLGSHAGAPGLVRGALHEWIGTCSAERRAPVRGPWTPPLGVLAYLALRALEERLAGPEQRCGWALWIGPAVHPYPVPLAQASCMHEAPEHARPRPDDCLLALSVVLAASARENACATQLFLQSVLFIDPSHVGAKLWAADSALRCSSVTAIVLDGTDFDMAATRRLQLAARNSSALVLVARPPWEEQTLSAATTRWRVRRNFVTSASPAPPSWSLELVRCKGTQSLKA